MVKVEDLAAQELELQTQLEQVRAERTAAEALAQQKEIEEKKSEKKTKSRKDKEGKKDKPKRKMKTNKKFFVWLTIWAMLIQTYVLVMIIELRDPMTLGIVAGVVFGEVVLFFLGFLKYTLNIDLKHMDKNYNPNYDEENNLY